MAIKLERLNLDNGPEGSRFVEVRWPADLTEKEFREYAISRWMVQRDLQMRSGLSKGKEEGALKYPHQSPEKDNGEDVKSYRFIVSELKHIDLQRIGDEAPADKDYVIIALPKGLHLLMVRQSILDKYNDPHQVSNRYILCADNLNAAWGNSSYLVQGEHIVLSRKPDRWNGFVELKNWRISALDGRDLSRVRFQLLFAIRSRPKERDEKTNPKKITVGVHYE